MLLPLEILIEKATKDLTNAQKGLKSLVCWTSPIGDQYIDTYESIMSIIANQTWR